MMEDEAGGPMPPAERMDVDSSSSDAGDGWWSLHGVGEAHCSVLRLGDVHIMLDCGCDAAFSDVYFERLAKVASKMDLILVSHYDLRHSGALAAAKARYGLDAPVYATLPTAKMGCLTMYDAWAAVRAARGREYTKGRLSLEDVDECYTKIRPLKFEQPLEIVVPAGEKIVVTAHRAGHSLGGAFWRIRRGADTVVYAVDVHHASERLVAGASFAELFSMEQRPSVLITDAAALDRPIQSSRRDAEEKLVNAALETLRRGGNVLMPVETVGRALELALVMEDAWRKKKLSGAYDLVLVHSMARNVLEFARSQLEWMNPLVAKEFDANSARHSRHPLALSQVRVVASVQEALIMDKKSKGQQQVPKCVLAARPELETGAAAALLRRWSSDPKNLVLMTAFLPPGAGANGQQPFATKLLNSKSASIDDPPPHGAYVTIAGDELRAHRARRRERREARAAAVRHEARTEEFAQGVLQLEEEEEGEEGEEEVKADEEAPGTTLTTLDAGVGANKPDDARTKRRRLLDSLKANFTRFAEPLHPMLSAPLRLSVADEYGAPIPPQVAEALAEARSSLLGLESREGYSHLQGANLPVASFAAKLAGARERKRKKSKLLLEGDEEAVEEQGRERPAGETLFADDYDALCSSDSDVEDILGSGAVWESRLLPLRVACGVVHIGGLEGLCDARSLKALISSVAPRALLVVPAGASRTAAEQLLAFAKQQLPLAHVNGSGKALAAPGHGETVGLAGWLGRAPLLRAELSWSLVGQQTSTSVELRPGLHVCRLDAAIDADNAELSPWQEKEQDDEEKAPAPAPPADPAEEEEAVEGEEEEEEKKKKKPVTTTTVTLHNKATATKAEKLPRLWLSAKEVVLPQLKALIEAAGVKTTFRAGSLVCDGEVIVRKEAARKMNAGDHERNNLDNNNNNIASSRLVVDGPLCAEYFIVSDLVKSAFCLV